MTVSVCILYILLNVSASIHFYIAPFTSHPKVPLHQCFVIYSCIYSKYCFMWWNRFTVFPVLIGTNLQQRLQCSLLSVRLSTAKVPPYHTSFYLVFFLFKLSLLVSCQFLYWHIVFIGCLFLKSTIRPYGWNFILSLTWYPDVCSPAVFQWTVYWGFYWLSISWYWMCKYQ